MALWPNLSLPLCLLFRATKETLSECYSWYTISKFHLPFSSNNCIDLLILFLLLFPNFSEKFELFFKWAALGVVIFNFFLPVYYWNDGLKFERRYFEKHRFLSRQLGSKIPFIDVLCGRVSAALSNLLDECTFIFCWKAVVVCSSFREKRIPVHCVVL